MQSSFDGSPCWVVPDDAALRDRLHAAAATAAARLDPLRPPAREDLSRIAAEIARAEGLPEAQAGYAMVEVSNHYWRDAFAAVPPARRLLLLPHCLREPDACRGEYSETGLACRDCGACGLGALRREAEALGYSVLIAEGTPGVMKRLLDGDCEAVIGMACLEVLDRAFARVAALGIPHIALPLLRDGCRRTAGDLERMRRELRAGPPPRSPGPGRGDVGPRTYLPLMRATRALFEPERLTALLADALDLRSAEAHLRAPLARSDRWAFEWLAGGGKRLRPFVLLAAFLGARHGEIALRPAAPLEDLIPDGIARVAVGIEALHKASLVHDDLEDEDARRDGAPTMHARVGPALAINVGDLLVGLGYRLIAAEAESLGGRCVADITAFLAETQLRLCRGQGGELIWWREGAPMRPLDALSVYALKTAPAFHVALYAGLRIAEAPFDRPVLKAYARALGVAYQIHDDLRDWERDEAGLVRDGADAVAGRPTLIHLLALEQADEAERAVLTTPYCDCVAEPEWLLHRAALYERLGAFQRARELLWRYHLRARKLAEEMEDPSLRGLLRFLVEMILGPARSG